MEAAQLRTATRNYLRHVVVLGMLLLAGCASKPTTTLLRRPLAKPAGGP